MKLRELIAKKGDQVARETYGKSTPIFIYEPKVPQALKNAVEKNDNTAKNK